MELLLIMLLVLLALSRAFAEVAERLGQPGLVGELAAGILLGLLAAPVARVSGVPIDFVHDVQETHAFEAITELGIFFLMLLGGLDLRPRDMAQASRSAFVIALGGLLVPLAAGLALGWWLLPASDVKTAQSVFLGTALAITAVPVSIRVLRDLGRLDTRVGSVVVSAAVYDDVLSLVLLAVLTALLKTGAWPSAAGLLLLGGKVLLFFAVTVGFGRWILPRIGRVLHLSRASEFPFSTVLVTALAFGVLAEQLGMHFILGAFMAGLFFQRGTLDDEAFESVRRRTEGITTGFLAPIFFASIGLHLTGSAVVETPWFLVALLVIAFFAKLLGGGLVAYLMERDPAGAAVVGSAMSARGAVELIIADIALRAGLFDAPTPTPPIVENMFSAVVIMAVVTTVATPVAVNWILRWDAARDSKMLEQ
ncbi:MAG TPA: cation:proton antiporter [Candidatus Krumholzibacteria bacterium]|nr:cation:proton antiporter [Candidatus Krumholzibacteria bacterium]